MCVGVRSEQRSTTSAASTRDKNIFAFPLEPAMDLQMQTASIDSVTRLIHDFKLMWQSEVDDEKRAELIAYTQVC